MCSPSVRRSTEPVLEIGNATAKLLGLRIVSLKTPLPSSRAKEWKPPSLEPNPRVPASLLFCGRYLLLLLLLLLLNQIIAGERWRTVLGSRRWLPKGTLLLLLLLLPFPT